jgi:hypothetical protein
MNCGGMSISPTKVDNPYLVTFLLRHLYLSGLCFGVLQELILKRHMFKRDWPMWSKYDHHSRLNS